MAQIGYGYGSEYQLMRFLGHHRNLLEERISKGLNETGIFRWLDFGFDDPMNSISGDKEIKGLSFLKELDLPAEIVNNAIDKYHKLGINDIDNWQNWDAIFTLNGTVYLVEAKAHVSELSSGNKEHGGKSKEAIRNLFEEQLQNNGLYEFTINDAWLKEYYQLANRLAIAAFLNECAIKTKVLYIYFINGYNKRIVENQKIYEVYNKNANKKEFEKAILKEKKALSILDKDSVNLLLAAPIFIKADSKEYEDEA